MTKWNCLSRQSNPALPSCLSNLILCLWLLTVISCATLTTQSVSDKAFSALGVYNSAVNAALCVVADMDRQAPTDDLRALRWKIVLTLNSADETVRPFVNLLRSGAQPEGVDKVFLAQAAKIQESLR